MTFLSLAIERSSLVLQKDQLEYQEIILCNHINTLTEEESDFLADNPDAEEDNPYLKWLENEQEYYDAQKSSIESQLKVINSEVESYDKAIDTNIKSECKLSISV